MQVSTFRVENLLFEGTELGLNRQLAAHPGIESLSVDIASGIIRVRHDEAVLSGSAIRRAVADCGYWSPDCEIVCAGKKLADTAVSVAQGDARGAGRRDDSFRRPSGPSG